MGIAMSNRFVCAILLFVISSITTQTADAADEYANVHSVAVVSAIGELLMLHKVEARIFRHPDEFVLITSWGIDDWITKMVTDALSPRFAVKHLAIDTSRLADCDGYLQCTAAVPPRDDVDAYVIVFKSTTPNLDLTGLGIARTGALLYSYAVYAVFSVVVVGRKNRGSNRQGHGAISGCVDIRGT